jgi:hypothetical protein
VNHRLAFTLAIAGAIAGCETPRQFATPDASWETHTGQLKFTSAERVLIGEVIVRRRGTEDFQLEFQKGGGIPLMRLRVDATMARAEGPLARGAWQGPPDQAPKPLRGWLELRDAFAARKTPGRFVHTSHDSQQRFDFIFDR